MFVLPTPVALAMWLAAFHPVLALTVGGVLTLALVLSAMALSLLAFAKELGPEYGAGGSRVGLIVVAIAILAYIAGSASGSDPVHVLSIATFYLGSVLYLGGTRSLISALPSGLVLLSLYLSAAYGNWGTIYVDGLSWVLASGSAAYLVVRRNAPSPAGCGLCGYFRLRGRTFCSSCGRMVGRVALHISRRRLEGFAAFSAVMLIALSLTVPLVYTSPTVALVSFGLGGSQANQRFAPLPNWGVSAIPSKNGSEVNGYTLSQGKVTLQAYVATSQTSYGALSAVNSAKANTTPYSSLPAGISGSMGGYILRQGRTEYVGVQGVFPTGTPTGSGATGTFVAIDLRQPLSAFQADRGAALYGAASSVIGWSSSWGLWSPILGPLLWLYQTFSQSAYICSFSVIGVILFTVARDDELAKGRRVESVRGLEDEESRILDVFVAGPQTMTGEELFKSVRETLTRITDSEFYDSLDELVRRDLVTPLVILRTGAPKLYWKRTI